MQLSTRVLPRNSNFEPTQASANQDSEPNIAPSFDPEELQRLFWRDIFSLDIWNLERSVGSVQSLICHFETAFSVWRKNKSIELGRKPSNLLAHRAMNRATFAYSTLKTLKRYFIEYILQLWLILRSFIASVFHTLQSKNVNERKESF